MNKLNSLKKVVTSKGFLMANTVATAMVMASPLMAETVTPSNDIEGVTSAITSSFKVADISTVIQKILTAGIPFFLTWWAARKVYRGVKGAFSKGKLSI